MLFDEEHFKHFARNETSDAVDETARLVAEAGGFIFAEPAQVQGWMYGFGFADPDGHCWNMVHMDIDKLH